MSNSADNDINSAVYRSNDSIKNFKIRVKLERLTSNALLPSLPRIKIGEDLASLLDKMNRTKTVPILDEGKASEYEEVIIGWQEKMFSQFEFEKYGKDMGPNKTVFEEKYYDDIQKMKANRKKPGRIFTYIENDPHRFEKDLEYFMTDSPNEEPSYLALGMNNIRKRRVVQPRFKLSDAECLPTTNLIKQKPTPDELRTNHLASLPYQTMYIMADLTDKIDAATAQLVVVPQVSNDHVLCTIHVYANGTIILEPDFNGDKMGYIIETGNYNNEVYHYYLEHASLPIHIDDLVREKKLLNEICLRQEAYLAQSVGNEFDTPPPTVLKLNIFGEIVSGKNFEYDNIYVYYALDLPDKWYAEPSMIFSGYTHTASATRSSKYDDIVYYSHLFEFELWYKPTPESADHELPRMPKIYFQVASQDSWGRHRTEGYTYIDIPSFPGFYDENLSCWRPRGDTIFDELRRFFIGGSIELEDLSYVAIPKHFESEKEKKPLSRFGFRTISTGELNVRLNVVFQSHTVMDDRRERRVPRAVNRYGFDAFMSNINNTLDEYERARQRALEVRQSALHILEPNTTAF